MVCYPTKVKTRNFLTKSALLAGACLCGAKAVRLSAAEPHTARMGRIGARRSPWFTKLEGQRVRCTLCPRACVLAPGRRGPCRVRENRKGTGYTLVYGTPAILQTDPIERKPFFHVLPASRSLSVATAGCPYACKFCQVWDMALVAPEEVHTYEVSPAEVVRHARAADVRSVAYTYGEPVAFFEYMLDTARLVREEGLLNLLHSNGAINPAPLAELCPVLDGANIDLKGWDDDFYRDVCGGEKAPVLETLRALRAAGVHLEITSLLIPTLNDQPGNLRAMCRWIKQELGAHTPLHFSRFYPLYQLANLPPTPVSMLEKARALAGEEGLEYVYIANVPGHAGERTYCPACGETAIDRIGFVVEAVAIDNGHCSHCGHRIPGIWS